MAILLIRIAILFVIFLGGLFAILAIAGKEWRQRKEPGGTATFGLWDTCSDPKVGPKVCITLTKSNLERFKG